MLEPPEVRPMPSRWMVEQQERRLQPEAAVAPAAELPGE
jgi:hypothetical protein